MTFNVIEEKLTTSRFLGDMAPANKDFDYPQSVSTNPLITGDQTYGKSTQDLDGPIAVRNLTAGGLPPGTSSPFVVSFIAGEDVVAGNVALLQGDGLTYNSNGTYIGIYKQDALAGQPAYIYIKGNVPVVTALTPGVQYFTQLVAPNTWTSKLVLPITTNASHQPCGVANNKLYVASSVAPYPIMEYSPLTNTWATKANAIAVISVASGTTTPINGYIYIISSGGSNIQGYNYTTNTWVLKSTTINDGQPGYAPVINNIAYLLGATTVAYDPITDTKVTKAAPPAYRIAGSISAVGTNIYNIGGAPGNVLSNGVDAYNTITNAWTSGLTVMVTPRSFCNTAVSQNKIYIISGQDLTNTYYLVNEAYDPYLNTWTAYASVPAAGLPFYYLLSYGAGTIKGKIYCTAIDNSKFYEYNNVAYTTLNIAGTSLVGIATGTNTILLS